MRRILGCTIILIMSLAVCFPNFLYASGNLESDLILEMEKCLTVANILQQKIDQQKDVETSLEELQTQYYKILASQILIKETFEKRATRLGPQALERQLAVADEYDRYLENVLSQIQVVVNNPARDTVLQLLEILNSGLNKKEVKPVFGSTPYRHLGFSAMVPVTEPAITPSFKTKNTDYTTDDLHIAADNKSKLEIAQHAESLQWNPISIYEWIKNNVKTEWYYGSIKGANQTLKQFGGNDYDQAALLVSLLRASGYPTRYVRGVIEFFPDIDKALNLTGTNNAEELGEFFKKAGIPYEAIEQEGITVNYQIEHIWVETLIPWSNYRGAAIDDQGKAWVALDTSLKGLEYTENNPVDMPDETLLSGIRDSYLEDQRADSPLSYLHSKITESLEGGVDTYEDLLLLRNLDDEIMNALPSGLQFSIVTVTHEYNSVPDDLKHKVRFLAKTEEQEIIFDNTVDVSLISGTFPSLKYEPETIEDQETINLYYGQDNTPPYLIKLRPVIVSDDKRLAIGQIGFSPGETFSLQIDLVSPLGTESITNSYSTGDICVFGIIAGNPAELPPLEPEKKGAIRLLSEVATDYIAQWNNAEDELSALFKTNIIRPIPTITNVGSFAEVDWLLGLPVAKEWKGVFIDADLRIVETTGGYDFAGGTDAQKLFITLSGMHGSALEASTLQDAFGVISVSTTNVLGAAAESGADIFTIDSGNIDSVLPGLALPDYIKTDITTAVQEDYQVRVPGSAITIEDWTGYGYFKEDLETGESGWMLSGMIAGGMTAGAPGRWDSYFVERMESANTEPGTADPTMAVELKKIKISDFQMATVGEQLETDLQVVTLDTTGQPVANTDVTFYVIAGSGDFGEGKESITVKSGLGGIARTPFYVSQKTSDNAAFIFEEGYTYNQQVGENLIGAKITQYEIPLLVPFTAYGTPGEPVKLNASINDTGGLLIYSGNIWVEVLDEFDNPISNQTVTFNVAPATSSSTCEKATAENRDTLLLPADQAECLLGGSTFYGQCSGADTTVSSITNSFGTVAYVIGGGIPESSNQISINCDSLSDTVVRQSTTSFGNCTGEEPPANRLHISTVNLLDSKGNVINAVKQGESIELKAKIHFLREEEEIIDKEFECDDKTKTCDKIIGARQFFNDTDFNSASVTFDGHSGTSLGNGVFRYNYTVENGFHDVNISGNAEITNRYSLLTCEDCTIEEREISLSRSLHKKVYGVKINSLEKLNIAVDEEGYSSCNVTIDYSISPAEYIAADAFIRIYEDEMLVANIPVEKQGEGFGTLARGFHFEDGSNYFAQVVLNSGTDVPLKSVEIELIPSGLEVKSITIPDLELHKTILPGETVKFVAQTEPADLDVQWSAMASVPNISVEMNANTGELTVLDNSENGWVIVRAASRDNPDCIFRDVDIYIGCSSCEASNGGSCQDSATYDLASIDVKIQLGRGTYGSFIGHLVLKSSYPSPLLLTPRGLKLSTISNEFEERFDNVGQLRQILTREFLVDIVTLSVESYEIIFYRASAVTGEVDELYTVDSELFEKKWTISSSNPDSNFLITENIGGSERDFDYNWSSDINQWVLNRAGLVKQERQEEVVGDVRIVTETVKDNEDVITSQNQTHYQQFDWGEEIVQTVVDPDGVALTIVTNYYENKTLQGSYGKVKDTTYPDSSWRQFTYDTQGRTEKEISTWLDADNSGQSIRQTDYSYDPMDPLDIGIEKYRYKPRVITETIAGVITGRTYYAYVVNDDLTETVINEQCIQQDCVYGDSDNLRTEAITHPEGTETAESGRTKSTQSADGSVTDYSYKLGSYIPTIANTPGTFIEGQGQFRQTISFTTSVEAPDGIANKSTHNVTVISELGETLLQTTEVYTGSEFETISWTVNTYDESGRKTATYYSNGTNDSSDWSCCNKMADTNTQGIETFYIYDDLKRLKSSTKKGDSSPTLPTADIVTNYSYNASGRTTETTITADDLQLVSSSLYDIAGRIIEQIDAAGLVTTYSYDPGGLISTTTRSGDVTEITETYLDGQIKNITGSGVIPSYYTYGINNDGSRWTKVYSRSLNSPVWSLTITDMAGRTIRTEQPGYGGVLVSSNSYDDKQRLIKTSVSGRADTLYVYDSLGNQVMSGLDIDGNGQLTTASMDRISGVDISFAKISANWWQQTLQQIYPTDNNGTPVTTATQRSQLTGLAADGEASETVSIDIDGNQTIARTIVDSDSKTVTQIVDYPDSDINSQAISSNSLLTESRSQSNLTTTFSYDALGRRTETTDPRTGAAITHYNDKGQVDYVEDAENNRTSFAYDPITGRKISQTNPDTTTSYFTYNDRGQQTHSWGSATYPIRTVFDNYGRQTELHTYRQESGWDTPLWPATPGTADVTTWRHHEATGLLEAKNNSTTYTYTLPGQLLTRTWARQSGSIITTYDYDASTAELTSIDYSDSTPNVTFTYDRLGRQKNITDGLGSRTFAYLPTLQPQTETITGLYSAALTRTYDGTLTGRNNGFTIDNGYQASYGFDTSGRFNALNWQMGTQSGTASYGYLPDSNLLETITHSSGTGTGITTYAYEDKRNVKTGINNNYNLNVTSDYQYEYDELGRRKNVKSSGSVFTSSAFNHYSYNDRSEVTGSSRYQGTDLADLSIPVTDESRSYNYDAIGNRETASLGDGGSQTDIDYTANALNQYEAVTGGDITGLTYDLDGNLTGYTHNGKALTLKFNGENRLVEITPAIPSVDDTRSTYLYDYQGRRVNKQIFTWDGTRWQDADASFYLYDGWNMVAELDGTGTAQTAFIWGLDLSQSLQGAGGVGGLLARIDTTANTTQHYFYDANGNVGQLINVPDGALAARYEYHPFGNTIVAAGPLAENNPFRFSTKYLDDESGLYYYGYRLGLNLYAFVGNNSIASYDMLGT